ncbi:class I SAM-dependent methyltransferase [Vibrio coralliilyticus]|uniref:SAM-dependent methyltransferase n=1 Tax=Vibrio coralliilyticus TaxID=190893 RepID=A0AAN0SG50_9VIBR|nr:class I SAM-dependent methyltransferase [Vibrio coralliilyticus]AIW20293.1 hypothetical protein IX92_15185 [Vibrio coralliilyticus]
MENQYQEIDGIRVYHSDSSDKHDDYNPLGLTSLYNSENKHFWFLHRKKYIFDNIKNSISKNARIIEIGAGTGNVSRFLRSKGYHNLCVGEMHFSGLKYAKSYGINDCYQFDLLKSPFISEFDVVCMFDVLEHIADPNAALKNVRKMLRNDGLVVMTLPAHNWLWSREDSVAGHKKRYNREMIENELESNGFEVVSVRYFFVLIVPLLYLRRLLNPDDGSDVKESEYSNEIAINKYINFGLKFICKLEDKLSGMLPNWFGGSLFVIGKKND